MIFRALHAGSEFAVVFDEARHLSAVEIILAALEGAVHGHGKGEATHKEIGAPASGIKIRLAKSPDAPDKDL